MSRKKKGPITKKVRNLCYDFYNNRITDNDFKDGILKIIEEYGRSGYILQGIGLAIMKWSTNKDELQKKKVWELVNDVDTRIIELLDNWAKKFE